MVSRKDVAAVTQPGQPVEDEAPAATQEPVDASPAVAYEVDGGGDVFLSEGMRHDLIIYGETRDPNTGRTVRRT